MQLSLKALFLAAAVAVASADERALRGLQTPPAAPAAPAPAAAAAAPQGLTWAEEVNGQINALRQSMNYAALTESPVLNNSTLAAARDYAVVAETRSLVRDNDMAMQRAKAAGYTGLVIKEYVAKVQCGTKTRMDCAKQVVKQWSTDPDVAFAAYDPGMKDIGTTVDDSTNNELVFITHMGKPK